MVESSIKDRLNADIKEAMKSNDTLLRDTIRMLNSAIKQVEVDTRKSLDDSAIIKILKTAYKQREDAANAYKEAGRDDLYEKESKEMEIITRYLPAQLDDTQLEAKIRKDMGKVMQASRVLNEVADGRRISTMVKKLLS